MELAHIPYRGTAAAVTDLLGRRVAAAVLPLAREGRVRVLAVGSRARSPARITAG